MFILCPIMSILLSKFLKKWLGIFGCFVVGFNLVPNLGSNMYPTRILAGVPAILELANK